MISPSQHNTFSFDLIAYLQHAIMVTLRVKYPHPRDRHIKFKEYGHKYFIKGSKTPSTSVTTVIHRLFPEFDPDAVIEKIQSSRNFDESSPYWGMEPQEIKDMWKQNGRESSQLGTLLHNTIEDHYNGKNITVDATIAPEWEQFVAFDSKFRKKNPTFEPYRAEWMIYDESINLAGTIDMVYRDTETGVLHIVDWKRSKEIKTENRFESGNHPATEHLPATNFWQYSLQQNIYKYILEKHYDVTVGSLHLVIMHPNQTTYKKMKVPLMTDTIDDIVYSIEHHGLCE